MQTVRNGKDWKRYGGAAAICLLVGAIVLAFLNSAAITRQLNDWKLLPQPERLTELYYENHAKLPTTYTPGTAQRFSFTTHNLEYRTASYSYTVVAQSEDGSQNQPLAKGTFTLTENSYNSSQIDFTPTDLGGRVKIVTTLTIQSDQTISTETIHYWVTKEGA